ncbi:hypothetical protein [Mesorhizobium atlanticum]|nr:hypothetical protein [Mesorhizobium atlanticum]
MLRDDLQRYGSFIVVPALNPLAVQASGRNTPFDGLNLKRVLRGRARVPVTEQLADAVPRIFFLMDDMVFDLHGFRLRWDFPPAASNAPDCRETAGMFGIVARHQGKAFICSEFGVGAIQAKDFAMCEARVQNAIIALGLVESKARCPTFRGRKSGQRLETRRSHELQSPALGNYEPCRSGLDVPREISPPYVARAENSMRLVLLMKIFSVVARKSQCTLMQ